MQLFRKQLIYHLSCLTEIAFLMMLRSVELCAHCRWTFLSSWEYQYAWRLGGAVVRRWTRDQKVTGSTPGRGTIKSPRSSIPPG